MDHLLLMIWHALLVVRVFRLSLEIDFRRATKPVFEDLPDYGGRGRRLGMADVPVPLMVSPHFSLTSCCGRRNTAPSGVFSPRRPRDETR